MKKLLPIIFILTLSSCSDQPPELPSHNLVKNGGVVFEIASNEPFTGDSIEYKDGQ